jgi:predicted nucleotidyltransferase
MNSGLEDGQLRKLCEILSEFSSVGSAILFGSRASGTFSPSSDVDIALTGDAVSLEDQIRLSARLNDNKALLRYDVIRYAAITNKKLIDQIKKHGVTIYERDSG